MLAAHYFTTLAEYVAITFLLPRAFKHTRIEIMAYTLSLSLSFSRYGEKTHKIYVSSKQRRREREREKLFNVNDSHFDACKGGERNLGRE
jgi:precorrin-6B methylase 1